MWKSLIVLTLLFVQFNAHAEGEKRKKHQKHENYEEEQEAPKKRKKSLHDQVSGQGYGTAGCGLGSIVFGPKPGMIQVIAATLNNTVGSQTFGISSGTSNCDIPSMGHEAAAFIEVNHEVVVKEAARGQGETIAGLAYILKCSDSAKLGQNLQRNFESIFGGNQSSFDSTRAILSSIENNAELKSSCLIQG